MLAAEWEADSNTCPHCGNPFEVCSDPEAKFYPQRQVCYADMEAQAARNRYTRLHEKAPYHRGDFTGWSAQPSAGTPYHFNDGVRIFAAPVDFHPDDDFLEVGRELPDYTDDNEGG